MEHEYHLSCQRSKTIDIKACVLLFDIFFLFYGFLSFVSAKIRLFSQMTKFYAYHLFFLLVERLYHLQKRAQRWTVRIVCH